MLGGLKSGVTLKIFGVALKAGEEDASHICIVYTMMKKFVPCSTYLLFLMNSEGSKTVRWS